MKGDEITSGADSCAKFLLERARKTNNVLVLVHGYNNSLADALGRARAFAEDIQFNGVVLVWSWPSQGWVSAYDDDSKAASWSADHFVDFITGIMRTEPKLNVDFFAHSMGNRLLVELSTKLRNDQQPLGRALVFAAPDIATDEFSQKILPDRFQTLYASEDDRALQVSTRFLHKSRRAGGHIDTPGVLIVTGVESIDTILRGHSYVFEDPRALRDIARLINMQQKASTRGLTERLRGTDRYWVINP